jgi:hypothetical protein
MEMRELNQNEMMMVDGGGIGNVIYGLIANTSPLGRCVNAYIKAYGIGTLIRQIPAVANTTDKIIYAIGNIVTGQNLRP